MLLSSVRILIAFVLPRSFKQSGIGRELGEYALKVRSISFYAGPGP